MKVIVYSTTGCLKCRQLKDYLTKRGISFSERDMQDTKSRSVLMSMNVFSRDAPILDADGTYMLTTDLFNGSEINGTRICYELGLSSGME